MVRVVRFQELPLVLLLRSGGLILVAVCSADLGWLAALVLISSKMVVVRVVAVVVVVPGSLLMNCLD